MLQARNRIMVLLPLVFHPVTMTRRGMAVFLAPLVFLPPVKLMTKELHISSVQSEPTPTITLFPVFNDLYHMPLPVVEVQLPDVQHCSVASALPVMEQGASCHDTVQFLSNETHEVVQLIFFLLSAGKLVNDCCARQSAMEHTPCFSKESQLRAMQKCASLLQDLPSMCHKSDAS